MIDTEILKGKNAFISGATGAIGGAVAKKLADYGCNLFLTGTSQDKLQKLSDDLSKFNINVAYKEGDLRHKDQIYKIITESNSYAETFDIVINAAGIFPQLNLHDSNDEIYEDLMKGELSVERIREIRSPIGLDIRARTPEEIAISIMSEILMFRLGGTGSPMKLDDSQLERIEEKVRVTPNKPSGQPINL